ncbi:MAG: hypothetical protein MZU95_12395 [Desulfomicrobium escambiense]|nr:hypothetical protein [Desulfomicrobium escambiense]
MQFLADLVNLINRQGEPARREGRGACSHKAGATFEAAQQDLRNRGAPPLKHGIGGASGTDEDVVRLAERAEGLFRFEFTDVSRLEGSHFHGVPDARAEILDGPL